MEDKRIAFLRELGYSEKAIELIMKKVNVGEMQEPTVSAKQQGTCGDIMILHLKIRDEIIEEAKFEYLGCAGLQSTGSALTEMIQQLPINKAKEIEASDIINYLGGIPKAKYECAEIARDALRKAIEQFRKVCNKET